MLLRVPIPMFQAGFRKGPRINGIPLGAEAANLRGRSQRCQDLLRGHFRVNIDRGVLRNRHAEVTIESIDRCRKRTGMNPPFTEDRNKNKAHAYTHRFGGIRISAQVESRNEVRGLPEYGFNLVSVAKFNIAFDFLGRRVWNNWIHIYRDNHATLAQAPPKFGPHLWQQNSVGKYDDSGVRKRNPGAASNLPKLWME